jgi:hypothetical protein
MGTFAVRGPHPEAHARKTNISYTKTRVPLMQTYHDDKLEFHQSVDIYQLGKNETVEDPLMFMHTRRPGHPTINANLARPSIHFTKPP